MTHRNITSFALSLYRLYCSFPRSLEFCFSEIRMTIGFCLLKLLLDEHAQTFQIDTFYEKERQVVLSVQNDNRK